MSLANVKVSPLHFIEKFEECLLQDLTNDEFPRLSGAVIKRFLNFQKNKAKAKICIYDKKDEEILAKIEIYEVSDRGNKSVLKGLMENFLEEKEESLFFLLNGTGNLAIEAYKSYQNFKSLFGIGSAVEAPVDDDESDEPTDEEIAKILDLSDSSQASDAVSEDFLQSVLQEADESAGEISEAAPKEKPAGEYSVTLSPEDLLKTIQDD